MVVPNDTHDIQGDNEIFSLDKIRTKKVSPETFFQPNLFIIHNNLFVILDFDGASKYTSGHGIFR